MKKFVEEIRQIRKKNKNCVTAQDGVDINKILKDIIDTKYYKNDFNKVTSLLLTRPVSYNEAILSIYKIIDCKVFEK